MLLGVGGKQCFPHCVCKVHSCCCFFLQALACLLLQQNLCKLFAFTHKGMLFNHQIQKKAQKPVEEIILISIQKLL